MICRMWHRFIDWVAPVTDAEPSWLDLWDGKGQ